MIISMFMNTLLIFVSVGIVIFWRHVIKRKKESIAKEKELIENPESVVNKLLEDLAKYNKTKGSEFARKDTIKTILDLHDSGIFFQDLDRKEVEEFVKNRLS